MASGVSRLAPSPTGALHLGNARTFLVNWALARRRGWRILLRIEDLDGPRVKADAADLAIDLMRWLGLDWDGEVLVQSRDLEPYRDAMRTLARRGLVFACDLTRSQIQDAASAPHGSDGEVRFPPDLRPGRANANAWRFDQEDTNYRFLVPPEEVVVEDEIAGRTTHRPWEEIGDFVVWTKRAVPAYQLAVVVDDARQGVTEVVRGDDLLPSAARQTLLYRALGLTPPRWWHLPLVVGEDGRRLAKRHGDTRVASYREAGVTPERVIALLARRSGIPDAGEAMTARAFRERFDPATLPASPTVFSGADHRWLLGDTS